MRDWFAAVCRVAVTLWVGAALIFVFVALKPVRSPALDSLIKSRFVIELFPGYYAFGFALLSMGVFSGMLAWNSRGAGKAFRLGVLLTLLSLLSMAIDWFAVYKPLEHMILVQLTNNSAPPAEFRAYHIASWVINTVSLGLTAIAVPCLHWMKPSAPPAK